MVHFLFDTSDDDAEFVQPWLRSMLWAGLSVLLAYIVIASLVGIKVIWTFILGFSIMFALLLYMNQVGYVRLTSFIFTLAALVGLLNATLRFGGITSSSYSALSLAVVIAAILLRRRMAFIVAGISSIAGWVIMRLTESGVYVPDMEQASMMNSWLGNTLSFFLLAVLVGMFSHRLRQQSMSEKQELQERRLAEEKLREQTRYLAALHEVTLSLVNRQEIATMLETILSQAEKLVGTQHGYMDVAVANGAYGEQQVGHGVFAQYDGVRIPQGEGLTGRVLTTHEPLVLEDYQLWPDHNPVYAQANFHAILAVPMISKDGVLGVIGLAHTDPIKKFSEMEVYIIERLAELGSLAVDNARLHQASKDELVQRELAQEALRQSDERLNLALDAVQMGTWDWDIRTGRVSWSKQVYQVFRETMHRFADSFESYLQLIHPDDHDMVLHTIQKSVREHSQNYYVQHRIIMKDQSIRWIEGRGRVYVNDEGDPVRMTGTVTDITEKKRADAALESANNDLALYAGVLEQRTVQLRVAAEVARAASAILDPTILSQQMVELVMKQFNLYYAGLFWVEDDGAWAVLRAATGDAGLHMLKQGHRLPVADTSMVGWSITHCEPRIALDVGEEAVRFNNPYLPDTRSELALPLVSRGQVLGALTIQSNLPSAFSEEDIATFQTMADQLANALLNARLYEQLQIELQERTRAEEEVRKLNADLEDRVNRRTADLQASEADLRQRTIDLQNVNRELEAFAYSVSHDLRAPLRAMDGFSRILLDDYEEKIGEGVTYLNRIRAAAQEMNKLIDDILRLSRITRSEMNTDEIDFSLLASGVMDEIKTREPDRSVEIVIEDGLRALADFRLLRVALENLLNNAWKFTGKTENPRIEVGAVTIDGKPAFFVRDNGIGFDMKYADKLFGAFQRLHSAEDFTGTGIGLAIVNRVIQKHGGRIWAESEPNKGAAFYFTLGN